MKNCPYCAEEIQNEAIKCKHCGEMVTAAAPSAAGKPGQPLVKVTGLLLLLVGLGTVFYFLKFYDTGVDVPSANIDGYEVGGGKVHNVGLMQNRQNGIIVGSGVAAAGLACFLISLYARGSGTSGTESVGIKLPSSRAVIPILVALGVLFGIALVLNKIRQYNGESRQMQQTRF